MPSEQFGKHLEIKHLILTFLILFALMVPFLYTLLLILKATFTHRSLADRYLDVDSALEEGRGIPSRVVAARMACLNLGGLSPPRRLHR
jgi:hypothetical protein